MKSVAGNGDAGGVHIEMEMAGEAARYDLRADFFNASTVTIAGPQLVRPTPLRQLHISCSEDADSLSALGARSEVRRLGRARGLCAEGGSRHNFSNWLPRCTCRDSCKRFSRDI